MRILSLRPPALAAAIALAAPAGAQEAEFLSRFAGSWSGDGLVRIDAEDDPNRVRCSMNGSPSENAVSMRGTCRAAIIFSREVGADIAFDPASGRYAGTYIGSKIGPAAVSGTRSGDAVNLTITWPQPVNGDTEAQMTIQNDGNNLRIVVSDAPAPGAAPVAVSDIVLSRS